MPRRNGLGDQQLESSGTMGLSKGTHTNHLLSLRIQLFPTLDLFPVRAGFLLRGVSRPGLRGDFLQGVLVPGQAAETTRQMRGARQVPSLGDGGGCHLMSHFAHLLLILSSL